MAVTIDATAGGANANSYLTLSAAQAIVDGMVEDADVTAWASATDDQKNRALYTATQRLDRERFLGARATDTQALQWPRTGVRKPDTYVNTYATGFPFRISEDYFTDEEIPDQVKRAQVVLAVYLNNNKDGIGLSGLEDFKSVQVGAISITPDKTGAVGADRVPPLLERYLTGLRISGPGNIAIKRS
jgi:hypothetical protein